MSFITKRERVFNEYELGDLPARNEGKIKVYDSCTDNRAWSHFGSDKTEHLVDIIKRNNEVCRPKYVPTEFIINTITRSKSAEIARLKRKIEECEQLIAAYDQLDLTPAQRAEIAAAHESIKDAYKDLDELGLNLDLSFDVSDLEGVDSDMFETAKSGGEGGPGRLKSGRPGRPQQQDAPSGVAPAYHKDGTPMSAASRERLGTPAYNKDGTPMSAASRERLGTPAYNKDGTPMSAYNKDGTPMSAVSREGGAAPAYRKDGTPMPANNKDGTPTSETPRDHIAMTGKPMYDASGRGPGEGQDWRSNIAEPVPREYDLDMVDEEMQYENVQCYCDASTNAEDTRVDEMQNVIISQDAKLNAMQNTLAVMESDICEPYCIYAHIYTALEKIFGVLRQNEKYKNYIDLLSAGKDTREIDITGKILYKLKILEKFSVALLSPCSQNQDIKHKMCRCYDKIVSRVETAFALTADEAHKAALDNKAALDSKRAQLVADIMHNDEIKDILSSESLSMIAPEEETEKPDDQSGLDYGIENYNIETENLKRLKDLQKSYEELMNCYEDLKHEKTTLFIKLEKYKDVEAELERMQYQLKEYCQVWHEREHYKKRSQDLDYLKEQYLVLTDETTTLEAQLKAETEINSIKNKTIDELRNCNLEMEKKLNDVMVKFEREKNLLMCKLKETECKCMCQEEQIKTLTTQMDNLLEHSDSKLFSEEAAEEMESLKEQINHFKEIMLNNDDEKHRIHLKYHEDIEKLRNEMEEWKSNYHSILERNKFLEMSAGDLGQRVNALVQDLAEKNEAVENLMNVITTKAQEINKLSETLDSKNSENISLHQELNNIRQSFHSNLCCLENQKLETQHSLQLAKKESLELLEKIKCYDELLQKQEDLKESFENEKSRLETENTVLRNYNIKTVSAFKELQDQKNQCQAALEECNAEYKIMEDKLLELEDLSEQFKNLQSNYELLLQEKNGLERQLYERSNELVNAFDSVEMARKESNQLLHQSADLQENIMNLNSAYHKSLQEKKEILNILAKKDQELNDMSMSLNDALAAKTAEVDHLRTDLEALKAAYNAFQNENKILREQINTKKEETDHLNDKIKELESNEKRVRQFSASLENDNIRINNQNKELQRESELLQDRLNQYGDLQQKYDKLQHTYATEKSQLRQTIENLELENHEMITQTQELIRQSQQLDANEGIKTFVPEDLSQLKKEIEDLKKEQQRSKDNIRSLQDKKEEMENVIFGFSEQIQARDDKIAILENYKNKLEEEVRKLQKSLSQAIEVGENIKDNSYETINASKRNVEAHHSKAVHNMSIEIAKLKNDKALLESRLSNEISEQSILDIEKYIHNQENLENELEIIICEIKTLEISCVGNSDITPEHCDTEVVLDSLRRIGKVFESKSSRSMSLQETLSRVQTSSQIVKCKADEAQKIAEKEKQKISKEKEETLKQKQQLEQELSDLKAELVHLKDQLKDQKSKDMKTIENLEAELLNQQLIINKINDSSNNYIDKLQKELSSLQSTYENCSQTAKELEEQNKKLNIDNEQYMKIIEELKQDLQKHTREIQLLKQDIQSLRNIQRNEASTQVDDRENINNETQTDLDEDSNINSSYHLMEYDNTVMDKYIKNKNYQNKVQILRADVSPDVDFVKNSYNKSQDNSEGSPKVNFKYSENEVSDVNYNSDDEIVLVPSEASKTTIYTHTILNDGQDKIDKQQLVKPSALIQASVTRKGQESKNSKSDDLFTLYKDSEHAFDQKIPSSLFSGQAQTDDFVKSSRPKGSFKIEEEPKNILGEDDSIKHEISRKMPLVDFNHPISDGYDREKRKSSTTLTRISQSDTELSNKETFQDTPSLPSLTQTKTSNKVQKSSKNVPTYYGKINKYELKPSASHTDFDKSSFDADLSDTNANKKTKSTLKPKQNPYAVYAHSDQSHKLSRVEANSLIFGGAMSNENISERLKVYESDIFEVPMNAIPSRQKSLRSQSYEDFVNLSKSDLAHGRKHLITKDKSVMVKIDQVENYESEIRRLTNILQNIEKDNKKKMEAVKIQYDHHIKIILSNHDQGVSSIQNLHEETLQDIIKMHENEVENLRSMSIEAMKRADKLDRENKALKYNAQDTMGLDEEPTKISPESKKRKHKTKKAKTLTKTRIEEFEIMPKPRNIGPCTCSLDVNVSETIRKIFEQADLDQTKKAENSYLRFIASKLLNENIDALDAQELSFLHLKVCRTWKYKLSKEEALQKKIDCLELELINKQRHAQKHIADLDRQVAEERRRLGEFREAVCKTTPTLMLDTEAVMQKQQHPEERNMACTCNLGGHSPLELGDRRSAGDLLTAARQCRPAGAKNKRRPLETNRAVLAKLDSAGQEVPRRDRRLYDEQPVRLRRNTPDRPDRSCPPRSYKK